MNNQFESFTITIPGDYIDDKQFFEYDDYDSSDTTTPTDNEVLIKAQAYVRTKQLKRMLSEFMVPVYFSITYDGKGSSGKVPTTANIVVGYISIDPFISSLVGDDAPQTLSEKQQAAASAILATVKTVLASQILQEYATLQQTFVKNTYKGSEQTVQFKETVTDYIDVPALSGLTPTVVYNSLP